MAPAGPSGPYALQEALEPLESLPVEGPSYECVAVGDKLAMVTNDHLCELLGSKNNIVHYLKSARQR